MSWRLANCLTALQHQVNTEHPNRPKQSDGTIGDAAHASRVSDHNPNSHGVVTAWDITTSDFTDDLAERLRLLGLHGDLRVKYVIYKHRITSVQHGWAWANYDGSDPHTTHIHLSVSAEPSQYDRTDPWSLHDTPQKAPSSPSAAVTPSSGTPTPSWYKRVLRDAQPMLHGPDVVHVQQKVGCHADGMFGQITEAHVKSWQAKHGLTADGVVGPATARKMG